MVSVSENVFKLLLQPCSPFYHASQTSDGNLISGQDILPLKPVYLFTHYLNIIWLNFCYESEICDDNVSSYIYNFFTDQESYQKKGHTSCGV